jgi:peroxiredoxin
MREVHSVSRDEGIRGRFVQRREEKASDRSAGAAKAARAENVRLIGVAVAVILAMVVAGYAATSYLSSIGLRPGQQAADFTVKDVDGRDFRLSDQRGKVVVMFFMRGTWCTTCLASVPPLREVQTAFAGRQVVMITLSTDTLETDAKVKQYSIDHATPWTYAIDRAGVHAKFAAAPLEAHYVIDRTGWIVYSAADKVSAGAVSKAVESALA